jgi:hypothetical protein
MSCSSCLLKGFGRKSFGRKGRKGRKCHKGHKGHRSFGAFTGGSPHSLLNMQGPYAFGRKKSMKKSMYGPFNYKKFFERKSFGACKSKRKRGYGCGLKAFGRKRRSFGAFTGGSPHSLLNMQGPYAFGRKKSMKKSMYGPFNYKKFFERKSFGACKSKRKRGFGLGAEGYNAQTQYPTVSANYFGSNEPFINASPWWYPVTGGQIQSPQMLVK